jgi:hypothetical protein
MHVETTITNINVSQPNIDLLTLAKLDLGLFRTLRKLGTSKERICSALCLSYAEYDFVAHLGSDNSAARVGLYCPDGR